MPSNLFTEKLDQAAGLVKASDLDVWLTFVRETAEGGDPILPLMLEGGLTWQSALLITKSGKKVAIVGNYDADPLVASGCWDEVIPYVQGIREPLVEQLTRLVSSDDPKIGVNYSLDDVKCDGLSHGMFLLLQNYLRGTKFENSLVSAESVVGSLRSRKTAAELDLIKRAISETDKIFTEISHYARTGLTELDVYHYVQSLIDTRGYGYGWDRAGNPIVNSGPASMIGHGIPSEKIKIEPGHIFHIDLGIVPAGYSSDIQRCWYAPAAGEAAIPEDVEKALNAVVGAIEAGAAVLKPGVEGWQVDAAARSFLVSQGYPEYLHAFGHQVGRVAHDGGAVLGPKWERYGKTPMMPIERDQVYTLELGVIVEGRGYLGLEEMVAVTKNGIDWLSEPQRTMPLLQA